MSVVVAADISDHLPIVLSISSVNNSINEMKRMPIFRVCFTKGTIADFTTCWIGSCGIMFIIAQTLI